MSRDDVVVSDDDVIAEMERVGGSFVRALGAAMDRADHKNLATLKAAFPEYWQTYSDRAAARKKMEADQ